MAVVGVAVFELHLPGARSLKDKRRVVRSMIERLHRRHRISIAETGLHDLRQRSEVSIAVVAQNQNEAERALDLMRAAAEDQPEAMLCHWQQESLDL